MELPAGADAKLGEHLAQVVPNGAGLMNRRVPISGFDRPSRASRATWASWAVSGWLAGPGGVRAGWAVRLRLSRPIEDTSLTVGEDSRDEPPQLGIEV